MPSDFALKAMNAVHRTLLGVTRGRAGWHVKNMPVLELTTTGRRSGLPRAVLLTSPAQDGSTLIVVASKGGEDTPPAWFLNLQADPEVEVALQGGPKVAMRAYIATAEERSHWWPRVIADHKNYAGYQRKTSREIPLVLLVPERS